MSSTTPSWPRYDLDLLNGRRQRRLRRTGWMRDLVRETSLSPADFIWPLFIADGHNERSPVRTMPGVERLSIDLAVAAARDAAAAGIPALALFPNTPTICATPTVPRPTTPTI